ncbi:MAG: hypothetical protein HN796_21145 [Gemmatimonadetes bacterium]|nr:hypothetical protein [Gemmatimonadota bacterium]
MGTTPGEGPQSPSDLDSEPLPPAAEMDSQTGGEAIGLPVALLESLKEAVVSANFSQLRDQLDELETLGDSEQGIAKQLRELSRSFDMKAIGTFIEGLSAADESR